MHSELRGTDIKWIAKGYWGNRFTNRVHPKVKADWLVAVVTGAIGIVVLLVSACAYSVSETTGPDPIAGVGIALVLVGLGFFLKGQFAYEAELNKFADKTVAAWESGNHQIPDAETVEESINGG